MESFSDLIDRAFPSNGMNPNGIYYLPERGRVIVISGGPWDRRLIKIRADISLRNAYICIWQYNDRFITSSIINSDLVFLGDPIPERDMINMSWIEHHNMPGLIDVTSEKEEDNIRNMLNNWVYFETRYKLAGDWQDYRGRPLADQSFSVTLPWKFCSSRIIKI